MASPVTHDDRTILAKRNQAVQLSPNGCDGHITLVSRITVSADGMWGRLDNVSDVSTLAELSVADDGDRRSVDVSV